MLFGNTDQSGVLASTLAVRWQSVHCCIGMELAGMLTRAASFVDMGIGTEHWLLGMACVSVGWPGVLRPNGTPLTLGKEQPRLLEQKRLVS